MTRLFNDPDDFAAESATGFSAASARWVRPVAGGVVRSTRGTEPTVSVVIGGGSGHYPAFAGLVGPGLAHGAVMGNLFASPSSRQVFSVAQAASEGRGVLLSYGNYAGDVLHFSQAQERLREAGIDCRTVTVTDDIYSAPADQPEKRRGIAGDLVVFKTAGAAAEAGYDLDEVERIAQRANDHTRSMGVAFGGCTLPGASEPLFTVPSGRMAIGLGIHGEPGIAEVEMPTAAGLAELFVSALLDDRPEEVRPQGARVVPILNGLGSVKYEELYVVYATIDRLLTEAGITVVSPEVGEFCTSFDMAGASLTLLWLDDELETLWHAPCDTPAFRRGAVANRITVTVMDNDQVQESTPPASAESQTSAAQLARIFAAIAEMLDDEADELGRIDRIAGDGDHGIGMQRGSKAASSAASAAAKAGAGARTTLHRAGEAWADVGGGTSGAIWGEMLTACATAMSDDLALTGDAARDGILRMKDAVMSFSKAQPGDKTMIDSIVPFADSLSAGREQGLTFLDAWTAAANISTEAAQATARLTAKLGRARAHGDKSLGTPDPGAISFALVTHTILTVLKANVLKGDD